MKLAIVVDSSCGLSRDEAKKRGWYYLPLYMNINGKEYADGIDMSASEFYKIVNIEDEVRTSATPPAVITDLFEKITGEYDHVIVFPLSMKLSSQTNNLKTFANEFKNIHVVDSLSVGSTIVTNLEVIEEMAKKEDDITKLMSKVNELSKSSVGFAVPATMKWLVKGGRVSSSAAAMANLLKIVPIIAFKDGGLDKYGKGRVFGKTYIKTVREFISHFPKNDYKYTIYVGAFDGEKKIIESVQSEFDNIEVTHFPPIIAMHTGPEVIALIATKKK